MSLPLSEFNLINTFLNTYNNVMIDAEVEKVNLMTLIHHVSETVCKHYGFSAHVSLNKSLYMFM